MPTLYVENIPKPLYDALRARARKHRRSIAAEILSLLEENIPTEKELKLRQASFTSLRTLTFTKSTAEPQLPSSEDLLREDRTR